MILFIGDSLAVGTPLQEAMPRHHVVKRAQYGERSVDGVRSCLHPLTGARVVVVSLGTNDARRTPREITRAVRMTKRAVGPRRCLVWVDVAGVPGWRRANIRLKREHLKLVHWARAVESGKVVLTDGIHPDAAGYAFRARLIRRAIINDC